VGVFFAGIGRKKGEVKRRKGVQSLLVALNKNGERINLLDEWKKQELLSLREREQFFCPVCQSRMRLKLGEKKQYHFAHIQTNDCHLEHESHYHMQGKALLYRWLQNQGYTVELEKYLPAIRQRPDLFIEQTRTAVEFQCSTIAKEQVMKRTESYQKEGIDAVWILGGIQYKRHSAYWISLSSFQAIFSKFQSLLYFCPRIRSFTKCAPLIPFSPAAAFSHSFVYPLKTAQFPALFQQLPISKDVLKREWKQKKRRWRTHSLQIFHHGYQSFLRKLYVHQIPPSFYPPEAGVPLPSLLAIQDASVIWQSYILLEVIGPLASGYYFSLQQVYNIVRKQMQERPLLYFEGNGKRAVEEYLQFLSLAGIVEHAGLQKYRKKRNYTVPKTVQEAMLMDEALIETALQLFPETWERNRV
jgi:competence protein CoiA